MKDRDYQWMSAEAFDLSLHEREGVSCSLPADLPHIQVRKAHEWDRLYLESGKAFRALVVDIDLDHPDDSSEVLIAEDSRGPMGAAYASLSEDCLVIERVHLEPLRPASTMLSLVRHMARETFMSTHLMRYDFRWEFDAFIAKLCFFHAVGNFVHPRTRDSIRVYAIPRLSLTELSERPKVRDSINVFRPISTPE